MCPYSELFWSVFSRIRTEYGEMRSMFRYSVRMRESTYQITPNTDTFYAVHQTVNRIVLTSLYLQFETSKISCYDMKLKL